jgi:hypothetical protein
VQPELATRQGPPDLAISRAFVQLAEIDDSEGGETRVRVRRADDTRIEGRLFDMRTAELTIVDAATGGFTQVAAADIHALEVLAPRRRREWALAVFAIIGAIIALAGYSLLPWVRLKNEGDFLIGFTVLYLMVAPLFGLVMARTRLRNWLTQWKPLYPK